MMASSRASGSVSTDDSERLGTQSKENQDTNISQGAAKLLHNNTDAAILDLIGGNKGKSPARSIGNKSRNSIEKSNSMTEEKRAKNTGSISIASNGNSHHTHSKDALSLPSADTSGGGIGYSKRRHNKNHGSNSHTTSTATTSSGTDNIGAMVSGNGNISKAPQSGLTIKVGGGPGFASPAKNINAATFSTPESQVNHSSSTTSSHLIKMNPRDSASPRRNRGRSSKSKAYKEYESSFVEQSIDSISLNSWKEGGTIASNTSRASASVQSSSVGGLAYVETPKSCNAPSSSFSNHHFDYKKSFQHSQGQASSAGPRHHNQYHPTNTANSVGSRSTTSKRSRQSKSSSSHRKQQQQQQQQQQQRQQPSINSKSLGPGREEQILFEQRLCDQGHGVAVRKIHSNGKSQLRFVKCVSLPKDKQKKISPTNYNHNMSNSLPLPSRETSSSRSVTSLMGRIAGRKNKSSLYSSTVDEDSPKSQLSKSINEDTSVTHTNSFAPDDKKFTKALTWGNKKKVLIPLYKFIAVRKGKTTKRTMRNTSDASKLLSIVTSDRINCSLDIEAPTRLDRDKFAKAFSVFLGVPLEDELVGESVVVREGESSQYRLAMTSSHSIGDDLSSLPSTSSYNSTVATPQGMEYQIGGGVDSGLLPNLTPSPTSSRDEPKLFDQGGEQRLKKLTSKSRDETDDKDLGFDDDVHKRFNENRKSAKESQIVDMDSKLMSKGTPKKNRRDKDENGDNASAVSSLTQGFDQEIVEELHQALTELRAELEASRAEAARAVKVAEQAIQSAESCSSNDWNSTVTHKAAEAAAQAQKRSAEAISKQRQAEEKLAAEKKSATFWRKQAQIAEEDAGGLQTRLAVAEVERAGITEELEREKRKAASYIQTFKRDYAISEGIQRETLANAAEQNKLLEIELDGTRRDLIGKAEEVKMLQDSILELKSEVINISKEKGKKKFFGKTKKTRDGNNSRGRLLLDTQSSSAGIFADFNDEASLNQTSTMTSLHNEQLLTVNAETANMRKQFELLRRTTLDELSQLPNQAKEWANVASKALTASQSEVKMLKNKLAMEMANRRKLLGEVQDLRGAVRVYCRPRPMTSHHPFEDGSSPASIISVPSHEVGLLHREIVLQNGIAGPMSFDFDRMFTSNTTQRDIYAEMEELVLSSLDGYNSCLVAFGQNGCGKTHSLIGDFSIIRNGETNDEPNVEISDCGIHLLAMQQIFTVSKKRRERFQDYFTMTIVEIHDEKIIDSVADTDIALSSGQIVKDSDKYNASNSQTSSSKNDRKLEIRTNIDGETIVQGLITVPVKSYEDVEEVWKQSLAQRAKRVEQLGKKLHSYEASTHVIVTLRVVSTNSVTGVGTVGKVQFVDLAASDVIPKRGSTSSKSKSTPMDNMLAPIGNTNEWKYANKSIAQLADVVNARYQFSRTAPYRNSTLTHLLNDSLESDTKVLLLACVSSDARDLQNTANTMRFAAKMKKVIVGKATKHTVSFA